MTPIANFLDTNILVYATADGAKSVVAQELMSQPFMLCAQALNEFAHVARGKLGLSWSRVAQIVEDMLEAAHGIVAVDADLTKTALRLVQHYNLSFYDAVMVAAALKADCTAFFSEDLQSGLVIDGKLTITNPFR